MKKCYVLKKESVPWSEMSLYCNTLRHISPQRNLKRHMVDKQYNVYSERFEALTSVLKIHDFGGMTSARSKCSAPIVLSETH
jgi:hypothetical protein